MRKTKRALSLVLAAMMIISMLVVGAVSASAIEDGGVITTFDELRAAANQGGTYSLGNDILYPSKYGTGAQAYKNELVPVNKPFILNGNGHTISSYTVSQIAVPGLFVIHNGAYVDEDTIGFKIYNCDISGYVDGSVAKHNHAVNTTKLNSSYKIKIVLENCQVHDFNGNNNYGALYLFGSPNVTLKNCTVKGNGKLVSDFDDGSNAKDMFLGSGATLNIEGGEYGEVFLNSGTTGAAAATIKDAAVNSVFLDTTGNVSSTVDLDNSVAQKVVNEGVIDADRSSDPSFKFIRTAADLQDAFTNGGDYIIANDIPVTDMLTVSNPVTINGNGYTITTSAAGGKAISNNSTLTLDGVKLNSTAATVALRNEHGTDAVLNITGNSKITSANNVVFVGQDSVLNVIGTTSVQPELVAGNNYAAIQNTGNEGKGNTTVNIENAKLTANDNCIYFVNTGNLNISGAKTVIKGASAVLIKSGNLKITGGKFEANGAGGNYTYNGNGGDSTGDAVIVDNCSYPGGAPTVSITGGTFTSENGKAVGSYVKQDDARFQGLTLPRVDSFITGGTFSSDVSAYVAADKFSAAQTAGTYKVQSTTTAQKYEDGDVFGSSVATYSYSYRQNIELLGAQQKVVNPAAESDGNDANAPGLRFVAYINSGIAKGENIEEYGFVVAKVNDTITQASDFSKLTIDGGNGQKVINCTGSSNLISGDYGQYNTDTTYKYVTLAINGMSTGNKVAVRFYVKTKDGKVYYGNYRTGSGAAKTFGGIVVGME